jgi:hypothetical protein
MVMVRERSALGEEFMGEESTGGMLMDEMAFL